MTKRNPLADVTEADVEATLVRRVKAAGGVAEKFTSPSKRSVPDRLVMLPIDNPEHRAIVAQYIWFVECKRPGAKPTPKQAEDHVKRRAMGYRVDVLDSKA